jgi:hypothetical protein
MVITGDCKWQTVATKLATAGFQRNKSRAYLLGFFDFYAQDCDRFAFISVQHRDVWDV